MLMKRCSQNTNGRSLRPLKIGVLGPGAVGGLLAALLCRSGNQVCCFGRESAVDSILRRGIRVQSAIFGAFDTHPTASMSAFSPLDVVFIAVKAPTLEVALGSIVAAIGDETAIVPLLNGIGHRELIRDVLGLRVVVGTIGAVEVTLGDNREVLHRSSMVPHMELASDGAVSKDVVSAIASTVKRAGLSVAIGPNENEVIWKKLVRLSAIATLTTYMQSPVGSVRTNQQSRDMLAAVVTELSQVARSQGVRLCESDVMHQIDCLPQTLTTSMQRDVGAGRPSEVESILGEPLRLGKSLGLPMPMTECCYSFIKAQVNASRPRI